MTDEAKPRQTADFKNALAVVAANPEELLLAQARALAEAAERTVERILAVRSRLSPNRSCPPEIDEVGRQAVAEARLEGEVPRGSGGFRRLGPRLPQSAASFVPGPNRRAGIRHFFAFAASIRHVAAGIFCPGQARGGKSGGRQRRRDRASAEKPDSVGGATARPAKETVPDRKGNAIALQPGTQSDGNGVLAAQAQAFREPRVPDRRACPRYRRGGIEQLRGASERRQKNHRPGLGRTMKTGPFSLAYLFLFWYYYALETLRRSRFEEDPGNGRRRLRNWLLI